MTSLKASYGCAPLSARPLITMACHCTGCQRMTASAFSLSALYPSGGFEVTEGERIVLKFVRRESSDCSGEVVFPKLGIRKALPEGQPVLVQLPMLGPGEYEFKCGMDMITGKLVVRPR